MGTLHELPHAVPLAVEAPGRHGDRCEPLRRGLPEAGPLCRAAEGRRLDPRVALTLLVERALVLDDLRFLGHDVDDARLLLTLEARAQPALVVGPGHPNGAYARGLEGRGPAGARSFGGAPLLPARLHDRIDEARLEAILDEAPLSAALDEALAWERAALAGGRTMGEWALLCLLAAL